MIRAGRPPCDRSRAGQGRQYHRPGEGAARQLLLPPCGRRRGAAPAQAGAVPARARHRDPRPRARRPALDPPRRGAPRAHPGLGPPRPLPRAERPQARRGAPRQGGAGAALDPGAPVRPSRARAGRERPLEPDGDPRGDSPRAQARHRRRDHDVAAQLDPPRRRRGQARDRGPLGSRPARLARRARPSPLGERGREGEGEGRRRRREARRPLGRRDRVRGGLHRRRGAQRSSRAAPS